MLAVSEEYLRDFAGQIAAETRLQTEAELKARQKETYLTRAEVGELLNVDSSTLWRWEKRKYLTPIRIGTKVRYRRSDINKLLAGQ